MLTQFAISVCTLKRFGKQLWTGWLPRIEEGDRMLTPAELRQKARKYRADAKSAKDDATRELYLAVAKYLTTWAAQLEAKDSASAEAPPSRQAG